MSVFAVKKKMNLKCFIIFLSALIVQVSCSRVLELSDKFSDIRKDGGYWLVKFYAPWCGHCKRLEPIWAHIAQALYKTNIRVGRIDCTRFPSIASEFNIFGYPTIKFIRPDEDFSYIGDRNKEDILNFAIRMAGPPVQEVTRSESLTNIKNMNQLFFMYVGDQEGALWENYHNTASKMQAQGFFYAANEDIAKQHVDVEELPAVFVYKDSLHYFYSLDSDTNEDLNSTLFKWINEERFDTFPKISRGNMHEVLQTKKYIVLVVVEENKLHQIPAEMMAFKDTIEALIRKKRDKYHRHFQFGWVGAPDIANSIAMEVLPLPYLLVLNSTTYEHYVPDDLPTEMTLDAIDLFLEQIHNQSLPAYGGVGLMVRLYRAYFESSTVLVDMWTGNPVLTTFVFGVPLTFLSFILYSICCADILDAEEDDEEDAHIKRD